MFHKGRCLLLLYFIGLCVSVDGRVVRQRRQGATSPQYTGDLSEVFWNGYNQVRDIVVPVIRWTGDRLTSNWNRYKETINGALNDLSHTWNRYQPNLSQGFQQANEQWNQFKYNVYSPPKPSQQRFHHGSWRELFVGRAHTLFDLCSSSRTTGSSESCQLECPSS